VRRRSGTNLLVFLPPLEAVSTEPLFPVDTTRLEQLLQLQERLLTGTLDEITLGDRLCQSAALVLGASGVRLVRLLDDHGIEPRGAYGIPFVPADDAVLRQMLAEHRPVLGDASHEHRLLTLPIAAVALRHARAHRGEASSNPGASEVLVTLSHDLRQPLNVMLGYTQLLIDDTYGPCNEEQRQVLTTIERHARELHTVLTGALDLVRLERQADEATAEPFAVVEVLRELCTGSLAHRAANDVALTWHADPATPPLCSDRFRVRQVLQNLIDNALRHTERGEVAVTAVPYDRRVRLQVSDTGCGIAAGDLPHVFAPFRTGSRGRTGSGLGLYIVKRFCESLGGDVSVASTPGTGTCFTIDLPTQSPPR